MKFTGKLKAPIIDYITGKMTLLFEPCEDFRQTYEELKDCEKLSLEIKRYRRKRSLDANAYYWVLCTKLAKVLQVSNQEIHNQMLRKYGQPEIFEGKAAYITIQIQNRQRKRLTLLQTITCVLPHKYVRDWMELCTGRTSYCVDRTHTTPRKWLD